MLGQRVDVLNLTRSQIRQSIRMGHTLEYRWKDCPSALVSGLAVSL